MKRLFKKWSVLRILTFALGLLALALSIRKDFSQGILGVLLIIIAIANIGTTGISLPGRGLRKKKN